MGADVAQQSIHVRVWNRVMKGQEASPYPDAGNVGLERVQLRLEVGHEGALGNLIAEVPQHAVAVAGTLGCRDEGGAEGRHLWGRSAFVCWD